MSTMPVGMLNVLGAVEYILVILILLKCIYNYIYKEKCPKPWENQLCIDQN